MRLLITIVFLFIFGASALAQQQDSLKVLAFDDYYQLIIENHPIVKQANLLTENAAMELRMARGSFDPKLKGKWKAKNFNDTEYYDKLDVALEIPTWLPINPVVGMNRNEGSFLSNEDYISPSTDYTQVYAGVSASVGRGLFIDKRRATVRKAQLFQQMAEAEQIKEINKILLTAAKDYWDWYYAYNNYVLLRRSIVIAEDIFDRTKMAFTYGEAAPMDTVQAKINLLNRITAMQQANVERITSALALSNHLWNVEGNPLELTNDVRPEQPAVNILPAELLAELLNRALENHPDLQKLNLKNESLLVDRKLARENIKPTINLNYYLLDQPFDFEGNTNTSGWGDNYKVGLDFSVPIFLRNERARVKQVNLQLEQNNYALDFLERQLMNDINSQYNEAITTASILDQQAQMVENYELLLTAERLNLQNGESDLFKLNVQMDKLIESQSKLLKLRSVYQKDVAELYWAAGITNLGQQLDQQ